MKRFFRSIRLALFDANCLCRRLQFDAIKVQMKGFDLFEAAFGSHEYGRCTLRLGVTRDLKVILLLAYERIVRIGKIESFVSINSIMWQRSVNITNQRIIHQKSDPGPLNKSLQFLKALIAQDVPVLLLKWRKADALHGE